MFSITGTFDGIGKFIKSHLINIALTVIGKILAVCLIFVPFVGRLLMGLANGGINVASTIYLGYKAIAYAKDNFKIEELRKWCLTAISNYNFAIDSFLELKLLFEQKEINADPDTFSSAPTYEDD